MGGNVVLITGATGGIGNAAAIGLATMGARVGITGRDLKSRRTGVGRHSYRFRKPGDRQVRRRHELSPEVRRLAGAGRPGGSHHSRSQF